MRFLKRLPRPLLIMFALYSIRGIIVVLVGFFGWDYIKTFNPLFIAPIIILFTSILLYKYKIKRN